MFAAALLLALSSMLSGAAPPSAAQTAAETSILEAFRTARVVAVGENHGHLEFHDLILRVLETPGAAGTINDIAVEWGNALYQDVVDRYSRGDDVPWDSVTMAWRSTVVSPNTVWDAPVYERFFREVRRINARLAPELQYRILLADSPVNWAQINSAAQLRPYYDRAQSMADVVRRESLLRGRRTLFLAGGLHVSRLPRVRRSRLGVPIGEVTPIAWIELHNPGVTFVIQSMGSAQKLGLTDLVGAGAPRVLRTAQSSLGATLANRNTTLRNNDGTRADVYGTHTLAEVVDAVILWDPADLTFPDADPATYAIEWYWTELNRRSLLLRNQPMDEALRKPESLAVRTVGTRHLNTRH